MRIALTIGLAIAFLAAVFAIANADASPIPAVSDDSDGGLGGRQVVVSETAVYSAFLPAIFRPHPCRLSPCLIATDTFEVDTSGWLTHTWNPSETMPLDPHEMAYDNGLYRLYYSPSLSFRMIASVSPITHPENTIIDVRARWTEFQWGNGYGIVFGADAPYSPTHMYVAIVSCLGADECNWQHVILWRLDNFEQGASHQPALPSQPPNPHARVELTGSEVCAPCQTKFNKWNNLRVIRDGPGIELQINGATVLTATDDTYVGTGYVGLLVENWENARPASGEIDNLYVYDLGPSGY